MLNLAASRLVLTTYSESAVVTAAKQTLAEIGGKVSCALVFVSSDYREHMEDFLELIQLHGHVPLIAGCSASGLIGTAKEAERRSGFSLLFLYLPETAITPLMLSQHQVEESSGPGFWQMETGLGAEDADCFIVLANPFTLAIDPWLREWNLAYPGIPCIGGLASGGQSGDEVFLFKDREIVEPGAIVLALQGGVKVHTIVSQGCRPIGEPMTVTNAEKNIIMSLASRPAYAALVEAVQALPEQDKQRVQGNLFAGVATSEYIDEFKTGDFLIRNILGVDSNTGTIAVGAYPRIGQTVQFQLRDRQSADDELRELASQTYCRGVRPFASILFSCNGRGMSLFNVPDHDAATLALTFGTQPSAGFFCNGEIGPVGATSFLHGYTASVVLLCDP